MKNKTLKPTCIVENKNFLKFISFSRYFHRLIKFAMNITKKNTLNCILHEVGVHVFKKCGNYKNLNDTI